jgi:uncharacterized protein (DUF1499 family)
MTAGAIVAMLLAGLGLGLRLYMERAGENRLRAGEVVELAALPERLPSNAALACPPGYCRTAAALPSPVFDVDAARLRAAYLRLLAGEKRITPLFENPRRIALIQRSLLFGFPDIVTAEFIALGPARSSLALYSRARYGRWDFGVNRRRVARWLARLPRLLNLQ